jgi:hypothetical protein
MTKKICSLNGCVKDESEFYAGNSQCKACTNGRKRDRKKYMNKYQRERRARAKDGN